MALGGQNARLPDILTVLTSLTGFSWRGTGDKVLRGGSWNNNDDNVRAANRNNNDPTNRNDDIGLRCAQ